MLHGVHQMVVTEILILVFSSRLDGRAERHYQTSAQDSGRQEEHVEGLHRHHRPSSFSVRAGTSSQCAPSIPAGARNRLRMPYAIRSAASADDSPSRTTSSSFT